jgi:outer membrane lipoprotein SlyB
LANYLEGTQMRKSMLLVIMLVMAFTLAACDTSDTNNQATSAQTLQPNLTGFRVQSGDDVIQTYANTVATGAMATGNVPLAAAIERVGTALDCLTAAGAISGNVYIQDPAGVIPQSGLSVIVNRARVERNILGCAADLPFSAQSVDIEPCAETGSFTYQNEQFYYLYAGVGSELCNAFQAHFSTYNPTVESTTQ